MQELIKVLQLVDDDYLIGLSNKGILKRSYKDLDGAEISVTDNDTSAEVSLSDAKCIITNPLGESKCSCPSRTICRHIITSILWLKQNVSIKEQTSDDNVTVAEKNIQQENTKEEKKQLDKNFIDILSSYPIKSIQKVMKKQYYNSFIFNAENGRLPKIEETSILSVTIPEENINVRIINPIEYSTCTCHSKEFCKHKAAAVLTWQIKHKKVSLNDIKINDETTTFDIKKIHNTAQYSKNFLSMILSDGLVRASDNISEIAESIAVMCHNTRMADCERMMREISNRLQEYIAHSSNFSTDMLFSLIMENIILLNKILKTNDEKEISEYLGEFKNTYVLSNDIEILPIAKRHFSSSSGYEGEIYYFINKTQNTKNKILSYSDVRPTFYETGRTHPSSSAPWGLYGTANELIKWELKLTYPKLSNGKISSSSDTKAEIIEKANINQSVVQDNIYTDFSKMIIETFNKNITSETERLVFISPEKCISSEFDEISQTHKIIIQDCFERQLTIQATYKAENKSFFETLIRAGKIMLDNNDKKYVIFGNAYIEKGQCYIYPIAIFDDIDIKQISNKDNIDAIDEDAQGYIYFSQLFHEIKNLLCDIIQCGINSFDIYEQIEDYSKESQKMGLISLSDNLNKLYNYLKSKNHTYSNDNSKIISLCVYIYDYLSVGIQKTNIQQAITNLYNNEEN